MITQTRKVNNALLGNLQEILISSPVLPLNRASIQSKISKHANLLSQFKEQSIEALLREKIANKQKQLGIVLNSEKKNCLETKQTSEKKEEVKFVKSGEIKKLLESKKAKVTPSMEGKDIPKTFRSSSSLGIREKNEITERQSKESSAKNVELEEKKKSPLNQYAMYKSICSSGKHTRTKGIKSIRHLDLLLDSHCNINKNTKKIKHVKNSNLRIQNLIGPTEPRVKIQIPLTNRGFPDKRYSPTAKFLHLRKLNIADNAKAAKILYDRESLNPQKEKAQIEERIFSDSFR